MATACTPTSLRRGVSADSGVDGCRYEVIDAFESSVTAIAE